MESNEELFAKSYLDSIISCSDLKKHELAGLIRGFKKGKKIEGIDTVTIHKSLHKQFFDYDKSLSRRSLEETLQALADLRNVAGLLYLKLIGEI